LRLQDRSHAAGEATVDFMLLETAAIGGIGAADARTTAVVLISFAHVNR